MAAISELIRTEGNGTLSFGDYTLGAKAKLDNYEFHGDKYKVKTFKEITKLERNGLFVYESVPGTAVTNFTEDENTVCRNNEDQSWRQIKPERRIRRSRCGSNPRRKEIIYGKSKNQCVFLPELRI